MRDWLDDVSRLATEDPIVMIIGNKCDIEESRREVFESDIESLKNQTGIEIVMASAKEATNINSIMENITRKLIERSNMKGGSSRDSLGSMKILKDDRGKLNDKNENCC